MTIKEYNKAVEYFSDNVYRFILKNIRDKEKARDIVQDSFEKLWIKHETIDASKVKSYLFATAYHTMIDMIRKESYFIDFEPVKHEIYSHEIQYSDVNEILQNAINRLPEAQRSVIMLRDFEGYSYREISEITELNESQVKVYIYRARVFLKNYIVNPEKVL